MKLLFIMSQPPHGSVSAQEGLDALLMGSAFTECAVLFTGEGVLQVLAGQETQVLGTKDFARAFGALKDYGVSDVYVRQADLARYRLTTDDLLIPVTALADGDLPGLLDDYSQVLNF